MAIKLVAMDLDGTLLNSQKTVSARNLAAIEAAKNKGVYITLATGRMYAAAAYFGKVIGANAPLICCNGAMVRSIGADQNVFARFYKDEIAKAVLAECQEKNWYAQWYIDDQIYAEDFRPELFNSYKTVENFSINEVGRDFSSYVHDVIQIVIRDENGQVPAIADYLSKKFAGELDAQQNTGYSVDLTPPGVTKAVGIKALGKYLGIEQHEIMVCGDADNDLAMLEYAGLSVVTQNGLPQAKALADFVTDSCDDDGVGKAIERYILEA
jgi:Cof subfamily protein (haloacid dehalogenase superfamily)